MANDTFSSSEDAEVTIKFSLQLITHIPTVTKTSKQSKSQLKTQKEVTTKEMSFICLKSNYTLFLQAILLKCNLRYNVSPSKTFRFKYYYSGRR